MAMCVADDCFDHITIMKEKFKFPPLHVNTEKFVCIVHFVGFQEFEFLGTSDNIWCRCWSI